MSIENSMNNHHFLNLETWDKLSIERLLLEAAQLKRMPQIPQNLLAKHWVMLFEKPSLRTRLSFEIGINKLGGDTYFMDCQTERLGVRESLKDFAKNIACWADGVIVRSYSHSTICELASYSSIPVINALCDRFHPCQAMADFLTLQEKKLLNPKTHFVFIGDGNNVAHSLMQLAAIMKLRMTVVTPEGYGPDTSVLDKFDPNEINVQVTHDLNAVKQADVIYCDTWMSMGSHSTKAEILANFNDYQVNDKLFERWNAKYFMHCQPMHRGEEVTSSIADHPGSLIYQQATNRMWVQASLMSHLARLPHREV
ncbi:MAG: ornithine carbamoyltransferase [Pseudomonadota bacterium]